MENNLGIIDTRFCEKSEFSNEKMGKTILLTLLLIKLYH